MPNSLIRVLAWATHRQVVDIAVLHLFAWFGGMLVLGLVSVHAHCCGGVTKNISGTIVIKKRLAPPPPRSPHLFFFSPGAMHGWLL